MGKKKVDPRIEKLVRESFGKGAADKDWEAEETIANPAHEPDPVDDLPPTE